MKKIQMLAALLCILVGGLTFTGCAGYQFGDITENNPVIVKTGVQLATIEYLERNSKDVDRLIEVVTEVKAGVESKTLLSISEVQAAIISLINLDNMLPAKRVLVMNLIEAVATETDRFVNIPTDMLPQEKTTSTLITVLGWIIDSAKLMK